MLATDLGGSIIVKQVGHAVLTVSLPSGKTEEYLITLPRLRIDGLWYGSPYIELAETSSIQSSTGWLSTVSVAFKFIVDPHIHIDAMQ
jgi:hypothetical protein